MSRLYLVSIALMFIVYSTAASAENLAISQAGTVYTQSLKNSVELANKALPLIAAINSVDNQAAKLGTTAQNYLSPQEFKIYRKKQAELHQLFAMQNTETSLTKDLQTLNKLYEATLLYHRTRAEYVRRRGTGNGYDKWLSSQKTDEEMKNALELLAKIRQQIKRTPIQ